MAELETQLLLMTQDMERDMIQKNEERDAALAGAALAASHTSGSTISGRDEVRFWYF